MIWLSGGDMERAALTYLAEWRTKPHRKPLVVRGARQVGKSTLVRLFAKRHFAHTVELDFERDPTLAELFRERDPRRLLRLLELRGDAPIVPGETLLFLDEVQAAPDALQALRYFREELPELHVIAAGSLLETVLRQAGTSVPVGRIEYLYLGPMSFQEFLEAAGRAPLTRFLGELPPDGDVPRPIHQELLSELRRFLVVGGMPEAVRVFLESGSYRACSEVQQSLLSTFRDDFGKYGPRVDFRRLNKVFQAIPRLVGARFKYAHVDREERARELAPALELLCLARVAHRVHRSAANGVPLGAELDERRFKLLFLDVGLLLRAVGLGALDVEREGDPIQVGGGAVAEQLVGQHLLYAHPPYAEPELHFWGRDKRGASAELDYVVSLGPRVVPIEVKAGATGRLKSLHVFLREKRCPLGVRFNSEPPSLLRTTTALSDGRPIPYQLLSLPLYLAGQLPRLVRALGSRALDAPS